MRMIRWFGLFAGLALGLALAAGAQQTYSSTDAPKTASLSVGERADIFLARRNYKAAVDLLKDSIRHYKNDASLFNRLGIAYQQLATVQQASYGDAEKNFKKAIKLDHTDADYPNNLGTVYYLQKKYKNAVKQFDAAIKIEPNRATYYVNLGGAEFAQKHFQPAIAAYRQALRLDPSSLFPTTGASPTVQDITGSDTPRFHYALARLFCSMGMLDDAVHQFRQAYEQHYRDIKQSLTDPEFAPLRTRPEYKALMGLPPGPAIAH